MHAIVHAAADVQDRDGGGALLMASLFGGFPFLIKLLMPTAATRDRSSRAR